MDYLRFIQENLVEASTIATSYFGKTHSTIKDHDANQVVTEADVAVGKFLIDKIKEFTPSYNIIDEEAGVTDNNSKFTWTIDPIDGTSNFAASLPMYGVMIGLLYEDKPLAGGIVLPFYKEIYLAEHGKGATCNGLDIKVSEEKILSDVLVAYGIDGNLKEPEKTKKELVFLDDLILKIRNYRNSNSCFDLMMVARGRIGAWLNRTSKVWDNVAPQIIIEEAGGRYTNFIGNDINYTNILKESQKNFTTCVAPPVLHDQLQAIIKNHNFTD